MKTTSACFAVLRRIREASAARYLGLSSSHWCCAWCYRGWTTAMQCWLAFHYTSHSACNRWWTRHQSATTSRRSYANYSLKVPWPLKLRPYGAIHIWLLLLLLLLQASRSGLPMSSWPGTVIIRGINFIIQQSRCFEGVCVPLCLMNCLFRVPASSTATKLFQTPLYGSGTVFRSISHLLRHFLSSALAWRHTSSNYCCHAREVTLSFMDTLIAVLTFELGETVRWPQRSRQHVSRR